eukprot:jgi/Botrbrau1/6877/Bobra.152_2s0033.1
MIIHAGTTTLRSQSLLMHSVGHVMSTSIQKGAGRVIEWRSRTSKNAGNFAVVAEETPLRWAQHAGAKGVTPVGMEILLFEHVNSQEAQDLLLLALFKSECGRIPGSAGENDLTVGLLNKKLDDLVAAESRSDKETILRWLLSHTTPTMMKWICCIILKDIRIYVSEGRVLRDYHPDAEDLYNVRCDLKMVIEELRDRSKRALRKDLEPGSCARPQLALPVPSAKQAFQRMRGAEFSLEYKFDGERMQLHRNGDKIEMYSRNSVEHTKRSGL